MNRRSLQVLLLVACGLASSVTGPRSVRGQSSQLWTAVAGRDLAMPGGSAARRIVGHQHTVALEAAVLAQILSAAPSETVAGRGLAPTAVIELPMPDGTFASFTVAESPIMDPELQAQFPDFKTYSGRAVNDPSTTVRFDWLPTTGFHAMILSATEGTTYVDPFAPGDVVNYVSYYKRDARRADGATAPTCLVSESSVPPVERYLSRDEVAARPFAGTLRTYRLAVATTGEYAAALGGTVGAAMSGITTTMNRVNAIYEREMSLRMVLIGSNSNIIYTNAGTDPYTNNDGMTMLCQNQANLNAVIGNANYDIGHVFSTGGGGIARLGAPCRGTGANSCGALGTVTGSKAMGVTGLPNPTGDTFAVDYVAHEMGHQWGANHTFNGTTGNCGGGNRNASTAAEPGSGSTIMSYSGICGAENLQTNSDDYFHTMSLREMQDYVTTGQGSTCDATTNTGNTAPTVSANGAFTVPANTPFTLTATGSDANGDALTYGWEQIDLGAATPPSTTASGPIFRSFPPTTSPSRTFPRLTYALSEGTPPLGEALPTSTRTMSFRVTVRDNRAGGGGINDDEMQVSVVGAAGPFRVTSPNGGGTLSGAQTVTWNVAGTGSGTTVGCADVAIRLSTDGGTTFGTTLLASTANDGAQSVTLPQITTSTARIRVSCGSTHIFWDASNANFSITPSSVTPTPAGPTPTPTITPTPRPTPTILVNGSAAPITVAAGSIVNVSVSNAPGGAMDWLARYAATDGNTLYQDYFYLNGAKTAPAVGLTSATVAFTMPSAAGPYNFRLLINNGYTSVATSATVTVVAAPVPTSTPSPTPTTGPTPRPTPAVQILVNGSAAPIAVAAGSIVSVSVSNAPGGATDWLARYAATDGNTLYQDYFYLNGSKTAPAVGLTSATVAFTMPSAAGPYNFRLLINNGYSSVATSATVTVVAAPVPTSTPSPTPTTGPTPRPTPAVQILVNGSAAPIAVAAGSIVSVSVSNAPGGATDWLARYAATDGNTLYQDYFYLNGSKTAPAVGLTSATVAFTMPSAAGPYNFRLLINNGYASVATSATITVGAGPLSTPIPTPTPTTGPTTPPQILVNGSTSTITVARGATVTVDVANGPGNPTDWVADYNVSTPNTGYMVYQYMNGSTAAPATGRSSARLTFTMPTATGTYNFRLLINNGYTSVATSANVVVP